MVPASDQILLYMGVEMKNGYNLIELNIPDEALIVLVLRRNLYQNARNSKGKPVIKCCFRRKEYSVPFDPSMTVFELIEILARDHLNYSKKDDLELYFAGKALKISKTLSDYNIPNGASLNVAQKSK